MFFNKSDEIKELVSAHTDAVLACYDSYVNALTQILSGISGEAVRPLTKELRALESDADTIRHNIIRAMLEGGLLIDSRKSLMHVIEGIDKVADITEDIIQALDIQQIVMPKFTHEALIKMTEVTKDQLVLLIETIIRIVTKYSVQEMTGMIRQIEALESEVDDIQMAVTRQLFETDLSLAEKLQYRDMINLVGSMSDGIEDVSDSIEIIMMARKV